MHKKAYWFSAGIILLLVGLDRLSKLLALETKQPVDLGLFLFRYTENTGASFGILQGQNILLMIIAIVVLGILLYYYKELPKVSFFLMISGLLGNLLDRIFLHHVIDFIDFGWFPVFNLADSMLVLGVAWLAIDEFRQWRQQSK